MNTFTTEGKAISERGNIVPLYAHSVELKDRIRTARQYADIDQSELARRCGVNPSAINHQESGKARSLSGELLMRIAKETKTRAEWILWEDGEMTSAASAAPIVQPYDVVLTHLEALPENLARSFRSEIEAKYYKALHEAAEESKSKPPGHRAGPPKKKALRLAKPGSLIYQADSEPNWTAGRDEAQIVEHNGIIIYANACAKRLLGWKKNGDLRGSYAIDRVHADDRMYAEDRIAKGPSHINPRIPIRIVPLHGPYFLAYIQSEPFAYDGKLCTLVSFVSLDHCRPHMSLVAPPPTPHAKSRKTWAGIDARIIKT